MCMRSSRHRANEVSQGASKRGQVASRMCRHSCSLCSLSLCAEEFPLMCTVYEIADCGKDPVSHAASSAARNIRSIPRRSQTRLCSLSVCLLAPNHQEVHEQRAARYQQEANTAQQAVSMHMQPNFLSFRQQQSYSFDHTNSQSRSSCEGPAGQENLKNATCLEQ